MSYMYYAAVIIVRIMRIVRQFVCSLREFRTGFKAENENSAKIQKL